MGSAVAAAAKPVFSRKYTAAAPTTGLASVLIGTVGPKTLGVEKMLKAIGFEYDYKIDPFDGGPHFVANTGDVTLVKGTRKGKVVPVDFVDDGRPLGIVCHESALSPRFRALGTRMRLSPSGAEIGLTDAARALLEVQPGDEVGYVAL